MRIMDFKPMPEEQEDALMERVGDMMDNGGRMPQEVTNEFLWAQGVRSFRLLRQTRETVRMNWLIVRALALTVAAIIVFIGFVHGQDARDLLTAIGP